MRIISHLDYLEWLGVDGGWPNPINPSLNKDMGYDVSDYYGVQPAFGTLEDLRDLIAGARRRGIRLVLDLVPNHTSDQHPWFMDARTSRTALDHHRGGESIRCSGRDQRGQWGGSARHAPGTGRGARRGKAGTKAVGRGEIVVSS